MIEIKIGKPVKDLPFVANQRGKWAEVWKSVNSLPNGDWLPVTVETNEQLRYLKNSVFSHRSPKLTCRSRDLTVFIAKKGD